MTLEKLKLQQLREQLTLLGLPCTGNRTELLKRLEEFNKQQEDSLKEDGSPVGMRSSNKRGKNHVYDKLETFTDPLDAENYVMQENVWVKSDLKDCKNEGKNTFLIINRSIIRGCAVGVSR